LFIAGVEDNGRRMVPNAHPFTGENRTFCQLRCFLKDGVNAAPTEGREKEVTG
jgi:hypothetical protein